MNSSLGRHSGNAVVTLSPKRSRGHDVACTTSPAAHLPALMAGSARCSTPALLSDRRQLRRGAEATVLSYHQRGLVLASRFSSGCFASRLPVVGPLLAYFRSSLLKASLNIVAIA